MAGWIGVDLDGTLATYDGWRGVEHIGEPVPAMLARVKAWLDRDVEVRILTARVSGGEDDTRDVWGARRAIELWCLKHLGRVLPVTCTKDFAMDQLWDDRAIQVMFNTGEVATNQQFKALWADAVKDASEQRERAAQLEAYIQERGEMHECFKRIEVILTEINTRTMKTPKSWG